MAPMLRTTDSMILDPRYPTAEVSLCRLRTGNSITGIMTMAAQLIKSRRTPIVTWDDSAETVASMSGALRIGPRIYKPTLDATVATMKQMPTSLDVCRWLLPIEASWEFNELPAEESCFAGTSLSVVVFATLF